MMEWKWSTGENYERSKRIIKPNILDDNIKAKLEQAINLDTIKENSAYLQSLNVDDGWDSNNMSFYENQVKNDFSIHNKREDSSMKMAEREMFAQTGMNPFLGTNNYLNDIMAQDQFLKPVSTNCDREKNGTNNDSN